MTDSAKRGASGGNARKEKLSPERRSEIAKEAAQKRWAKTDDKITSVIVTSGGPGAKTNFTAVSSNGHEKEIILPASLTNEASTTHTERLPEPPTTLVSPKKRQSKPMPKAFKGASSYAEKRLAEAIRERSEYMGRVAALNAEIPSLVSVIRALGGTPNVNGAGMMAYPPMDNNYQAPVGYYPGAAPYTPLPAPQQPVVENPYPNAPNIDPALFRTNSNPLPGLVPAAAQAPVIPGTSVGGALDLDYVPRDDDGPALPKMGSDWR